MGDLESSESVRRPEVRPKIKDAERSSIQKDAHYEGKVGAFADEVRQKGVHAEIAGIADGTVDLTNISDTNHKDRRLTADSSEKLTETGSYRDKPGVTKSDTNAASQANNESDNLAERRALLGKRMIGMATLGARLQRSQVQKAQQEALYQVLAKNGGDIEQCVEWDMRDANGINETIDDYLKASVNKDAADRDTDFYVMAKIGQRLAEGGVTDENMRKIFKGLAEDDRFGYPTPAMQFADLIRPDNPLVVLKNGEVQIKQGVLHGAAGRQA